MNKRLLDELNECRALGTTKTGPNERPAPMTMPEWQRKLTKDGPAPGLQERQSRFDVEEVNKLLK